MWYATEQVQLSLDESQDLLRRYKELDVTQTPQVAYCASTQVTNEASVGDENGDEQIGDEGCSPGGNTVWSNGEVGIRLVRLDSLRRQ